MEKSVFFYAAFFAPYSGLLQLYPRSPVILEKTPVFAAFSHFFFNFALSFWFRVFQDFFVFGFVFLAYLYDLVLNFEPKTLNPYST